MKIKYSSKTLEGIVILLILIPAIVLFHYKWEKYITAQINHEFQIAQSIASSLPKEFLEALDVEPDYTKLTEYQIIKNRLMEIAVANTEAGFVYLYTQREDSLYFIAGSESMQLNDFSPHGKEYPEAEIDFKRPFTDSKAFVTEVRGKWRSALIPIKDKTTGKIIAVFGLDFKVGIWSKDLWIQMAQSYGFVLLLILALLFLLKMNTKNRALQLENNERRELEKTLIGNNERFRTLFYNAPLGYQSLDAVGNIIEVNQQWLDSFGFTQDEVIGKWFGDFLSPAYQEGFRKRFPFFKVRGNMHSEFEMVHKNGSKLFIAFEGKIGYGLNGVFMQANCILQDITDRKQSKNEIASSHSLLNASLESTADGIIVVDNQNNVVLHNQKYAAMWRIPNEILANKVNGEAFNYIASQMIKPEEFLSRHKELFDKPGESGTDVLNLSDGRIFEWYSQPQKIGETIAGRVWSFRDITGRMSAEKALRQIERKHYSVIANISDIILISDIYCNIKYCSPNMEKFFGWLPEELIGTNGRETVHPEDSERVLTEFFTLIEKVNSVKTVEYRLRCKDGSYKLIELTGVNLVNDSFINGVLLNFHDITERGKEKEELIKAKEKAEENNRLKSELLAEKSREILTPLNGIMGIAELLNGNDLTSKERQGYIEIIQKRGVKLLHIINDILDAAETDRSGNSFPSQSP
jgi:PAS domain S-box-containing protein